MKNIDYEKHYGVKYADEISNTSAKNNKQPLVLIAERIDEFLESDNSGVIAIKGSWGTGKTYFWNEYWGKKEKHKFSSFKKYAYVSLFGVNSISGFKRKIIMGTRTCGERSDGDGQIDYHKLIEKSQSLLKSAIKYFKELNLNEVILTPKLIETLAFQSIQSSLICIDDFERKGKKLMPSEILGTISELAEKNKCKVILILNEEPMDKALLKEYSLYREKVIEQEMNYNPSQEYCFDTALKLIGNKNLNKFKHDCLNSNIIVVLKFYTKKMKIRNIRILRKIILLCFNLINKINILDCIENKISMLNDYGFYRDVVIISCICGASYHERRKNNLSVPPFKFLKDNNFEYEQFSNKLVISNSKRIMPKIKDGVIGVLSSGAPKFPKRSDEPRPKNPNSQIQWLIFLEENNFPYLMEYHFKCKKLIIDQIIDGYINESQLIDCVENAVRRIEFLYLNKKLETIYMRYKHTIKKISFMITRSSDDVVHLFDMAIYDDLYKVTNEVLTIASIKEISQTILILRDSKRESEANLLIKNYINYNKNKIIKWNLIYIECIIGDRFDVYFYDEIKKLISTN